MLSDTIKSVMRAPIEAFCGRPASAKMTSKPFIAICNSYTDIIPGHVHLDKVGEYVKQVSAAGGVPFVFNTIGVDDGSPWATPA